MEAVELNVCARGPIRCALMPMDERSGRYMKSKGVDERASENFPEL